MTRTQKIERIKKYRQSLYYRLTKNIPHLVKDPENATDDEIVLYNDYIVEEAKRDKNPSTFTKNFSF